MKVFGAAAIGMLLIWFLGRETTRDQIRRLGLEEQAQKDAIADRARERRERTREEAARAAERIIEGMALAPAQAHALAQTAHPDAEAGYIVTGQIDAPTALGVMLRKRFICRVNRRGDSWVQGSPCSISE